MVTALAHLESVNNTNWLIGIDSQELEQLAREFYLQLTPYLQQSNPPQILLAEPEPVRFLACFIAACTLQFPIFICNHHWQEEEWQQVFSLVKPDIIWASAEIKNWGYKKTNFNTQISKNRIMIPTGGSSGKIKFAIHTWETLMASVRGLTTYFNLEQVNSFCVLPLYHVSGLMQFMRSLMTGGKFAIANFKELASGQIYDVDITDFCLSLVPTQLQILLQQPRLINWLSQFKIVFLGGAPAWNELLETARYHQIRLAPTYGMTETASQIATLKPNDFLNGKINAGQILPHANVNICDDFGNKLETNKIGKINIQAQSLCLGYYHHNSLFQVDDLGYFDEQGYLNIVGRHSEKIITGGENVYPREIESVIIATGLVVDICVVGIPDKYWGQAVTAIYVPVKNLQHNTQITAVIKDKISNYKIPKYWVAVDNIPRNEKGKINRQIVENMAIDAIREFK